MIWISSGIGLLLSVLIVASRRWVWWKSLLCVTCCTLIPPSATIAAQLGRVTAPKWWSWIVRAVCAAVVMVGAVTVGNSQWLRDNEPYANLCAASVYAVSNTAVNHLGRVVTNDQGVPMEIPHGFRSTLVMGAFGVALGLLFFRQLISHAIALLAIGGAAGFIAGALRCAYILDNGVFPGTVEHAVVQSVSASAPTVVLTASSGVLALVAGSRALAVQTDSPLSDDESAPSEASA